MIIRAAEDRDIGAIVEVHRSAFPRSFLTRLGPAFLRLYYRRILRYPAHHFLVAESASTVMGFAAGFREPSGFYRALNRRWPAMMLRIIVPICRSPSIWARLLSSYRLSSVRAHMSAANSCELASLAVHQRFSGAGVGRLLVQQFANSAFNAGASEITLTTEADWNARVNAFYRSAGFDLIATSSTSQRRMNKYRLVPENSGNT